MCWNNTKIIQHRKNKFESDRIPITNELEAKISRYDMHVHTK